METTTDITPADAEAPAATRPHIFGAAASAGAGAIHLALAPAHWGEIAQLGMSFVVAGWGQLVAAAFVAFRPSRRSFAALAAVNAACVGSWAASRTIGLPVSLGMTVHEEIGSVDLLAAAMAGIAGLAAVQRLVRPAPARRERTKVGFAFGAVIPVLAVLVATSAALASPEARSHSHGDDHAAGHDEGHDDGHAHGDHDMAAASEHDDDHAQSAPAEEAPHEHAEDPTTTTDHDDHADAHAHGDDVAAEPAVDDGHAHDTTDVALDEPHDAHEHDDTMSAGDEGDPTVGVHHDHVCDEPVTAAQQEAATGLQFATSTRIAEYWDFDKAIADGYTPITPDGRPMVHYGRFDYIADGKVLDPSAPESLIYGTMPNGNHVLLGAMYLNDDDTVTPPAPGGCLTQWHDHGNLCIAPGVGMVGIAEPDGSCPPGSSNDVTAEMLHVWFVDLPEGPFSDETDPATMREAAIAEIKERGMPTS